MKNIIYSGLIFCLIISCGKNDGGCGNGMGFFESIFNSNSAFATFTAGQRPEVYTIYYIYQNSVPPKILFFIGGRQDLICPEEHLTVKYIYLLSKNSQEVPLKIYGEAVWGKAAGFGVGYDDIILADGVLKEGQGSGYVPMTIGLKQVYPAGAATVDFFLTVEFPSQGSFMKDTTYFKDHIESLEIVCTYDKF